MSIPLKSNFAVEKKNEAFYTGGKVQISSDGEYLCTQCGTKVNILLIQTGELQHTLEKDDDEVTSFCLSPDDSTVVVAGKSLLLRQWDWKQTTVKRTWKAIHIAPVSCMTFDTTSTLLATGGSDSTIKIWDVIRQYCTHNLKGHQGVISAVEFHPDMSLLQLVSAADDYKIRLWDLQKSECICVLEGHYSTITSLQIDTSHTFLYSGGRDKVIITWNLQTIKKTSVLPVYESVEAVILLSKEKEYEDLGVKTALDQQHFITAGSSGLLKVWNAVKGNCVHTQRKRLPKQPNSDETEQSQHSLVSAFICSMNQTLITVTYEHNIILHKLHDFSVEKQFVGYNDDILDIRFAGEEDSHIAVATNSSIVKVFNIHTWDCQILQGHTDIVLCVDVYKTGNILVTGSKDNNILVWKMNDSGGFQQVAAGYGHTHAVAAVAFSRLAATIVASGSQDYTIKIWPLPAELTSSEHVHKIQAKVTEKAHDKDINTITIAPNDKFLASGSQDRTAKLWSVPDLSLLGTFRGHKRGIWCVKFSPVDQCLATSSADGTLKLWGLTDFSCLKTFEGHESSVLKVCFVQRGMQLVSSGSDGLMKLWTLKTNECVKTFDAHDEKIWALDVNQREELIVTGAGDSNIVLWKDVTETEIEEAQAKLADQVLKEQQLSNLLQQKKYLKAIRLAITLNQPYRVLNIVKDVLTETDGSEQLKETLLKLRDDQLDAVLNFSVNWNMNSKHCHAAQFVIQVLLTEYSPEDLRKLPNFKSSLEALLPYTERHFQRMNRLQQQSTFVDYTWQSMKLADKSSEDIKSEISGTDMTGTPSSERENITEKIESYVDSSASDTSEGEEETIDKVLSAASDTSWDEEMTQIVNKQLVGSNIPEKTPLKFSVDNSKRTLIIKKDLKGQKDVFKEKDNENISKTVNPVEMKRKIKKYRKPRASSGKVTPKAKKKRKS